MEKSTRKHVGFEKKLQNWTIFAFPSKRSRALRIFASKSNVFLRILWFPPVERQGESSFFECSRPRRLRAKFEAIAPRGARQTEGKRDLKRVLEKMALQG